MCRLIRLALPDNDFRLFERELTWVTRRAMQVAYDGTFRIVYGITL